MASVNFHCMLLKATSSWYKYIVVQNSITVYHYYRNTIKILCQAEMSQHFFYFQLLHRRGHSCDSQCLWPNRSQQEPLSSDKRNLSSHLLISSCSQLWDPRRDQYLLSITSAINRLCGSGPLYLLQEVQEVLTWVHVPESTHHKWINATQILLKCKPEGL